MEMVRNINELSSLLVVLGVITAQEFRYFMVHMGMQFSEQEVDEMIREVDADGDGEIDYEGKQPIHSVQSTSLHNQACQMP